MIENALYNNIILVNRFFFFYKTNLIKLKNVIDFLIDSLFTRLSV